ncbi:Qat anti-phage system TatD family nuclease QatD [Rhizobium leguminosarum]|uniref:Qat anti-phage system TatD family nuclease QatD n=1 Tax=Rhizobium leguminosarum TaxID=384 RepID=UPI000A4C4261|nr:Qat anti-phage system TatD family nuclease QatD [Rhizobium leguminosarum]
MIDFHCHLDLFPEPEKAVAAAEKSGHYVLSVTTTPKAFAKTAYLARKSKRIRTALGLHPQIAHERKSELPLFDRLISETDYVGEVGLDGGPEYRKHYADQLIVFDHILATCQKVGGRVLSIHSRHAASDVLDALARHPGAGTAILHWFTGTTAELNRAIDSGCWFSVGRPMTKSKKGRSHIAGIPQNRILTETDAPFGGSTDGGYADTELCAAVNGLSSIWDMTIAETQSILAKNLRMLRRVRENV